MGDIAEEPPPAEPASDAPEEAQAPAAEPVADAAPAEAEASAPAEASGMHGQAEDMNGHADAADAVAGTDVSATNEGDKAAGGSDDGEKAGHVPTGDAMANLPGEVDTADASLDGMRVLQCIEWLRDRIIDANIGSDESEMDNDVRREAVKFLTSERTSRLMAYKSPDDGKLILSEGLPPKDTGEFVYFLRANGQPVSKENIARVVQHGKLNGISDGSIQSLLRLMNAVYVPAVSSNTSWPDSFRKEFSGQVHKFMATLTETAYEMNGHTVLYVPREDFSEMDACVRDKDLVQRLETTLIQIGRAHV